MTRCRTLWLAGLALVALLAGGLILAALWPIPSEAERKAASIREGIMWGEVKEILGPFPQNFFAEPPDLQEFKWDQRDGSAVIVAFNPREGRVVEVRTTPPTSPAVGPLTRLRRNLARFLPALGE